MPWVTAYDEPPHGERKRTRTRQPERSTEEKKKKHTDERTKKKKSLFYLQTLCMQVDDGVCISREHICYINIPYTLSLSFSGGRLFLRLRLSLALARSLSHLFFPFKSYSLYRTSLCSMYSTCTYHYASFGENCSSVRLTYRAHTQHTHREKDTFA